MPDDGAIDPVQEALSAIRALSADYLAQLPAKLADIERVWQGLTKDHWQLETARDLHRAVHGITGSGRVFGLPDVSDAARRLETNLQTALDQLGPPPSGDLRQRIAASLEALKGVVRRAGAST